MAQFSSEHVQLVFASTSEEDTDRLGALLAGVLQSGDVVALMGELGAGKTRLVRAIVAALCDDSQRVSSPTFVLMQQYAGAVPIFHFDAYRLADVDEFLELGAQELFQEEGICLIEWADRVAEVLPTCCLHVAIRATGPHGREFRFSGCDPRTAALIKAIKAQLSSSGCCDS